MATNTWSIELKNFSSGFAPLAFTDSLTEIGGGGHASVMTNADVLDGKVTQGPGLANLTAGTQAGAVTELINFIMDKAVTDSVTYGIGTSKLFKITPSAVTSDGTWPHAITNCTDGESIQVLKGNLYYFYNTASAGNIGKYNLDATFDDDWGSTVPTGAAALANANHPSDKKEDIILFGNGRYVGSYIAATNTLAPTKLDFGADCSVDDVLYNAGQWYLAVNSGVTGTNRTEGQIYLYDGAALGSTLSDETGVGFQRIGFLYRLNGVVYVCYQDLSSTGFIIGYIAGSQIKPLGRFTGTMPTFQQKTLYKNTILFLSSGLVYSAGAFVDTLPFQLSQIADGGYATCGAIAAPFGTPMIASTDGATNFKLAKFSGYDVAGNWKSIVFPVSLGSMKGFIDSITILTNTLASGASCSLTLETDQNSTTSNAKTITGTGKRRHHFTGFGLNQIEDFRVCLDWSGGSASNNVAIRSIRVNGHFVEST
jgi:hypothetical protein